MMDDKKPSYWHKRRPYKTFNNGKRNMSTPPTQRNVQLLTWSAQSFFHGQADRGNHYFSEVIQGSPQDANGVYESMWRAKGSPIGDSQYGMKVFHGLGGLQSTSRDKALAIHGYLLTKGLSISLSTDTSRDHVIDERAEPQHRIDAQGNYQTQVVYTDLLEMAIDKWCPSNRTFWTTAGAVASIAFTILPPIIKLLARSAQ